MSTVILDKSDDDAILTSSLRDIRVSTDAAFVDVSILHGHKEVFTERYYPADSMVTLQAYAQIFEDFLRTNDCTHADFRLTVTEPEAEKPADTWWLTLIYCSRRLQGLSDMDFLAGNFLLSSPVKRIAPGAGFDIPLFAWDGEPDLRTVIYSASVAGSDRSVSGELSDSDYETFQDTDLYSYHYDIPDIIKRIAADKALPPASIVLHSLSVHVGERSCSFFVDHSLDLHSNCFCFLNDFNLLESVYLPMTSVRKVKNDLSIASVNESSVPYDRSTSVTVEVEAGPLSASETEGVEVFLSSHRIYSVAPADDGSQALLPAIIADSTCEISDDSEKLNTVKFKWQLVDDRPTLFRTASGKIFSPQFNSMFA